jgi:hypothetical protein
LPWDGRASVYAIFINVYVSQWKWFDHNHYNVTLQQDRQCAYNIRLRRIHVTIVVVEKQ